MNENTNTVEEGKKAKRTYTKKNEKDATATAETLNDGQSILHFNMDEIVRSFNLEKYVTKKTDESGEETGFYLKLRYKQMWCKQKYPYSFYDYKIVDNTDHSTLCTVTIYEDSESMKILGKGTAAVSNMDLPMAVEADIMKHNRVIFAIGSAATKAYTNAGFGLQFDEDTFDKFESMKADANNIGTGIETESFEFTQDTTSPTDQEEVIQASHTVGKDIEAPDFIKEMETQSEEPTNETEENDNGSTDENIEQQDNSDAENNESEEDAELFNSDMNEDFQEKSEDDSSDEFQLADDELPSYNDDNATEELPEKTEMTLEEARSVAVTYGNMGKAHVTMGMVEEKQPLNFVVLWHKKDQITDLEIEAIKVIYNLNPNIRSLFEQQNENVQ